jgi:16S rRNA (uracil1498-N3)-methyltransferase
MEHLFYQPEISDGNLHLNAEESRHCIRVLRKKPGDLITVTDGQGRFYHSVVSGSDANQCSFSIQTVEEEKVRPYHIHLGISPTKNQDRIEWMIEKCVEIGIDKITFLSCTNTERTILKTDRLEKISISAMKQSHRAWLPGINPMVPYQNFVAHSDETDRFIAYVDHSNPVHLLHLAKPAGNYLVLVGPEGDFSSEELQQATANNFQKVSLGLHRLRTETAGLAACHILNLINS